MRRENSRRGKEDKKTRLVSRIKKDVTRFLLSEESKVLDADIIKAAVALGIIGAALLPWDSAHAAGVHRNFLHNSSGAAGPAPAGAGHFSHSN